ncbi:uncharacterized protein LOC122528776 isoform X2 [Frieseomelitta varia]|uniref:uncharacterized protein LOC122528776 isoform X2 n=1 Tax=Frieseomelitta varia TaxID=561572 RepID=UPI001CB67BB0|nr:uncharacterized protein LOC122528776 isoform X2 [Frieseomelitta varia]
MKIQLTYDSSREMNIDDGRGVIRQKRMEKLLGETDSNYGSDFQIQYVRASKLFDFGIKHTFCHLFDKWRNIPNLCYDIEVY